ncbi:MAG: glycosyltransferase family 4 protein [Kaiparowitsia implicata GSE-PSE-MK54-09C]|jgi:starch synthase|nr:glycosyltransferase family 4 protein [Kaiparowitsia implicata GSE-PSE-MK54-09C]
MLTSQVSVSIEMPPQAVEHTNFNSPAIALFHCYDVIEDFASTLGMSVEQYCTEFSCNYMFGYANALKTVGVRTVIFYISATVSKPTTYINTATGVPIRVLPVPKVYKLHRLVRSNRRAMLQVEGEFSSNSQQSSTSLSLLSSLKRIINSTGTYLSTPLRLLAKEMRQANCQALLCQSYEYARFDACVLMGKFAKIPVFAVFQGGATETWSALEKLIRPGSMNGCSGLIIPPRQERERVCQQYQLPKQKVAQIFNPLDVEVWQAVDRQQARYELNIPPTAKVVVSHGRIEIYNKGLDVLLTAWQRICRDRPGQDLRLLLLGTGSDADEFQRRIQEMNLHNIMWRNEFVNDRTVIQQYLSAADVYTMASRSEGFPIAPTEAMACGLPVVAANASGISDILEPGEVAGGIVVPCGDAEALAQNLGRLLDDDSLRQTMGQRARHRIQQAFAPEVIGQQLKQFLLQHSG